MTLIEVWHGMIIPADDIRQVELSPPDDARKVSAQVTITRLDKDSPVPLVHMSKAYPTLGEAELAYASVRKALGVARSRPARGKASGP